GHWGSWILDLSTLGWGTGRRSLILGGTLSLNLLGTEGPVGTVIALDDRLSTTYKRVRQCVRTDVGYGNGRGVLRRPEGQAAAVSLDGVRRHQAPDSHSTTGCLAGYQLGDGDVVGLALLKAGDGFPSHNGENNSNADSEFPLVVAHASPAV